MPCLHLLQLITAKQVRSYVCVLPGLYGRACEFVQETVNCDARLSGCASNMNRKKRKQEVFLGSFFT